LGRIVTNGYIRCSRYPQENGTEKATRRDIKVKIKEEIEDVHGAEDTANSGGSTVQVVKKKEGVIDKMVAECDAIKTMDVVTT
jgi:hypothetical protein